MGENKEIIAIDLGGTNLRVALVKNNKIIKYLKKKTPKTKEKLLKVLYSNISALMNKNVKAIGMASPGPLKDGVIRNPPNLPFKNFNFKKALTKKFKLPVEIENDANCVALAESKLGYKKNNFFILTLGTGIGGGIIIDDKIYSGKGYAGELGHIVLEEGKYFEDLWQEDREEIKKTFGSYLLIKELIEINNKKSKKILEKIANHLGQGIASLINVLDPEVVVLSGGIKETGNKFLKKIKKQSRKYILSKTKTEIKWTKLEHPGILGASLLVK